MSYRTSPYEEPRRTTPGPTSSTKPYVPHYHSYQSDARVSPLSLGRRPPELGAG